MYAYCNRTQQTAVSQVIQDCNVANMNVYYEDQKKIDKIDEGWS